MKKFLLLLLTILLGFSSLQLSAQQTLTVANGTATNDYVPIYGYWADAVQHNQVIYPETMLDDMIDSAITAMTFYLSSSPSNTTWGSATYTIKLGITSNSSFSSAAYATTSFTEVYSGGVQVANGELTIVFDTPFPYTGGNLLFDLTSTSGTWSSASFSGITSTGGSIYAYSSYNPNLCNFIPKTEFTYANPPLCMRPANLTVSDITISSATITWTGGDNDYSYNIQYMLSSETSWDNAQTTTSTVPSITLTNLTEASTYKVRVQTECSDGSETDWSSVITFQTDCNPTPITETDPWTEGFEGYTGSGEQPFVCWATPVTTPNGGPFVYCGYGEAAHTGQNTAELKGATNMLVLPAFSNDITTLRLSFWATAVTPSNGTLEIGIVTDMNDPVNNFEYVATTGRPGSRGSSNAGNGNYMGPFDFNNAQATSGRIALRYTSSGTSNSWNLDDFVVSLIPSCTAPVANSVTATNMTAFTADIAWTDDNPDHSDWMVYYKADSASEWEFTSASSTSVELTNLNPSTNYEVYVVTVCNGVEGTDQTLHINFTTTATCYPPTNASISQVAGTSAMISWDEAFYGANDYTLAYSEAGQDNWNVEVVDGTYYMLSNLQPGTAYDVMVYSNCEYGTADTAELNFTTNCLVGGNITIGDGSTTTSYLPEYCLYNYSYTQQIFLASEMNGEAEINSIAFNATEINNANRNLQIYLMHTTAANSNTWLSANNAQQVYSGSTTLTTGWNTFNFTTPFQYNGTDNLVVIMIDATGSWSGTNYFLSHNTDGNLSRYNYQDSNPYSTTSTPVDGTSSNIRNDVIFGVPCDSTSTCAAPNVYVTGVNAESINIAWVPGNGETSWEIEYMGDEDDDWTSIGTVSTTTYELDELEADVTYSIRIRSLCSASEVSGWRNITATTECTSIELPYTENFDNPTNLYGMVTCWTKNTNYSSYTTYNYPYINSDQSHSGDQSVIFIGGSYYYSTTGYYSYLASPRIDDDVQMNNLQIRFWAYKNSTNSFIQVGIMTDPDDYSTFVQVGQDLTPSNENSWTFLDVNTAGYAGNGHYIAFRIPEGEGGGESYQMYVDEITIDVIPDCDHVSNIHTVANTVTTSEAEIAWTAGGDESQWQVVYGMVGTIDDPDEEEAEDVYTPNIELTDLTANTLYVVYVKAVCSSENSIWMEYYFRSECGMISTLPYEEDFDFYSSNVTPDCWSRINTYSYSDYPATTSYSYEGVNSLYFYAYNNTYNIGITPEFDTTVISINSLQATFMYNHSTYSSSDKLIVGVMSDPLDVNTFVAVDTIYPNSSDGSWEEKEVSFAQYAGGGSFIAFKNEAPSDSYSYAYIDNLSIHLIPDCSKPSHLTVSNINMTQVTLSWTNGGVEEEWDIEYGPAGFIHGDTNALMAHATTNPYDLTELTVGTNYDVYIRSDCGNGEVSPWITFPVNFSTAICDTTDQCEYTLNLEDSYGDGWNGASIAVAQNGVVVVNNITVPSGQSQHTATVSLCGDVPTQLIWNSGSYDSECSFELLGPDGTVVATHTSMYGISSNTVIDTFTANCSGCMAPGNLAYTLSTDATSAIITWTAGSDETDWILEYQSESDSTWTIENISGTPTYTITNLTPATNYVVRVKSDCTDGMSGYKTISFLTPCASEIAPYSENFAGFNTNMSPCWERYTGLASTVFAGGALTPTTNGWVFNTSNVYPIGHPKLNIFGTACQYWLVSPAIDLSQLSNPALMFDLALTDYYNENPIEDSTAQADDQFMVIISTDYGVTWSAANATVWNNTGTGDYVYNAISYTGDSITIPLSQYAGQTIRIAFYGESTVTNNGDNDLHIANVVVNEAGSGPVVIDPTVATNAASAIAQTTATLNATITNPSNVTITAKGFEYRASDVSTYTSVAGTGTGNTFTANLTGLTANTSYTFKAFITFNGTTVYGSEMNFITPETPVEPCDAPTNLQITNITQTSAVMTWTAGGDETSWKVGYKLASASQWQEATVATTTYNIEGLTAASTYDVRVKAVCANSESDFITSSFTTEGVGIDNITLASSINLMPNPADNYIELTINSNVEVKEAVVFNAFGQMIQTVELNNNHARIDLSNMASGMYFVRVSGDNATATKKFIRK
jgi:hypothetical protein